MANQVEQSLTAQLGVSGAAKAIDFYSRVFGATEVSRMAMPGSEMILHAELRAAGSRLFVRDVFPHEGELNGMSRVTMMLYVEDVDATYNRAIEAGATALMPPEDAFWGDRYSEVLDPFGHRWGIYKHNETLSPEQIAERAAAAFAQQPGA